MIKIEHLNYFRNEKTMTLFYKKLITSFEKSNKKIRMKKTILLLSILIFLSNITAKGQSEQPKDSLDLPGTTTRLSLLLPSFASEFKIDNSTTFNVRLWAGFNYTHFEDLEGNVTNEFEIFPVITGEFRTYLDLLDNKISYIKPEYYTGTYLGFPISKSLTTPYYAIGGVVGTQNRIGKSMFWNIAVGGGFGKYGEQAGLTFLFDLGFGFILSGI
jgi:hypothetical protein